MMTWSSRFRGVHERFIASEGIDDVLLDMVDELVPVHVAGRGKVRALGQNENRNGFNKRLDTSYLNDNCISSPRKPRKS
jgi:hypothetical protein